MYSPEEENEHQRMRVDMSQNVPFAVHNTQHRESSGKKKQQDQSLLEGMKDFIVQKKLNFFEKLDDMEHRLKISQDRIEKEAAEERKADEMKIKFESMMTEAIYVINDVDRQEAQSRSSGGKTATTRDSDSDMDSSFTASSKP